MIVLLCTPYKIGAQFVQGGLVVWGANLLEYYDTNKDSDLVIIPISFDRKTFTQNKMSKVKRVIYGVKELHKSIYITLRYIRKKEVNVVHLCTSGSLSLIKDFIILKYAKYKGIKTIIHFHFGKIPSLLNNGGWLSFLLRKIVSMSDICVTMDMYSHQALTSEGYNNVVNIPNPLSEDIITIVNSFKEQYVKIPNRILYVGHVVRTKGVYEMVEACSKIGNVELRVIGKVFPLVKQELESITNSLDNNVKLEFVGEIPHDEVIKEMLQAEIFTLPSYSEGFPNVILESMACGCANVVTEVGAMPEMLGFYNEDKCGLCVPPMNVKALKGAYEYMLNNPSFRMSCGIKAQNRVKSLYSMPIIWNSLYKIWVG